MFVFECRSVAGGGVDISASHHSLAEMRLGELGGRASRASQSRASQYSSSRRSEQMRRRATHHHQQQQQQQHDHKEQQQQQQTTGDESSWETDRERGSTSSTGLLRRPQMGVGSLSPNSNMNNNGAHQRTNGGLQRSGNSRMSSRSHATSMANGDAENWTDHDMEIYMAHNTMRNDLVRL